MMRFLENSVHIENKELKERSEACSKGKYTSFYLVYKESEEVAFVAQDINKEMEYLVLYDLLVPSNICRKGNGTYALHEIEEFAFKQGFKKIILNPEPFKMDQKKEQLIEWYKSRGYSLLANGTGEMEKIVYEKCS